MTSTITQDLAPRLDLQSAAITEVMKAMYGLEAPFRHSSLERSLRDLVKVRGSQLNGCSYCLDMHTKDARAHGETEQRLYALNAWQETPFFSERERAALTWTEHLTLLASKGITDELFAHVREHFSEEELIHLTLTVVQINSWNRLVITVRMPVGSYQAGQYEHANA